MDECFSQLDQTTCAHSPTTPMVWLPPPPLTMKITTDAAYDHVIGLANL